MSDKNSKFPVQVICSTLNQMVNYLPIMQFQAKTVINLTVSDSEQNKEWDKNLSDTIGASNYSIKPFAFGKDTLLNHEDLKRQIKDRLKSCELDTSKILWNITGGQRYFTLAIHDIFKERPGDYLCYLEGNSNQFFLQENDNGTIKKYRKDGKNYFADQANLTIKTALQLMGFTDLDQSRNKIAFDKKSKAQGINKAEVDEDLKFYNQLFNDDFRKECFKVNTWLDYKNKEAKGKATGIEPPQPDFQNYKGDISDNRIKKKNNGENFGTIFENAIAAKVISIIEHEKLPVNEMIVSQSINFIDIDQRVNDNKIDEFDIIMVTANGKVVIFELKTGEMKGDVAKSTKYSTYAVGGVYGQPILIIPFKQEEIPKKQEEIKTKKDEVVSKQTVKRNHNIFGAIASAKKAKLETWGFDEIETKLKALLGFSGDNASEERI